MTARALLIAFAIAAACTRPANGKDGPMNGDPNPGLGGGPAATLALSATLTGTQLHLVLTNRGTSELKLLSHVTAGARTDLDWVTVTVTVGGAPRELRFMGPRDHAGRVQKTLAAGASLAHYPRSLRSQSPARATTPAP